MGLKPLFKKTKTKKNNITQQASLLPMCCMSLIALGDGGLLL